MKEPFKSYSIFNTRNGGANYVASYDTREEAEKVASGLGGSPPYYIFHYISKVEGYDLENWKRGEVARKDEPKTI